MLETKKIPVSTRTRRMDTLPRARPASYRPADGNLQTAPRTLPRRAAPPAAAPSRLARSEARLVGIAAAGAALVCGLIVLYLAAYAHVTLLGIDQASARTQLRQERQRNETLRAECDSLQSPGRVAASAAALGMTTRGDTPVQYIASPPGRNAMPDNGSDSDWAQGTTGGTTKDTRTTASFNY